MTVRSKQRLPIANDLRGDKSARVGLRRRLSAWSCDRLNLLFAALLIAHLIPIWAFRYFPSQDGPAHLESANVVREYHHPDRTTARQYYELNRNVEPTWLGHLVLAALMSVVSVPVAEKIFLSGYVLLLPLLVRYALRAVRPDVAWLSLMAFPFVYSFPLHMGFYYFCYSLPVFFLTLGYWLRCREGFTSGKIVTMAGLSLLLYFCHPITLALAYVGIGFLTVWLIVLDLIRADRGQPFTVRALWHAFQWRILPLCVAVLPTFILAGTFLNRQGVGSYARLPAGYLMKHLLALSSLVSFEVTGIWLSSALVLVFAAISVCVLVARLRTRGVDWTDGLGLLVAVYILVYLLAPSTMGCGSILSPRLALFPFFALVLWFGTRALRPRVKWCTSIAVAGISLSMLALHSATYAELNGYMDEYVSAAHHIESNTTLLPLSLPYRDDVEAGRLPLRQIQPFLHAAGHIATERHVVDLANYEGWWYGVFPIIFRPGLSPYTHIWRKDLAPGSGSSVDFITYTDRTGGRVDYVLIWGLLDRLDEAATTRSVRAQLEEGYDLIHTSPRKLMHLYRRKGFPQRDDDPLAPENLAAATDKPLAIE